MRPEPLRHIDSVADWAWDVVPAWERLARDTLGVELIRACERVGAALVAEAAEEGRNSDPQPAHFFPGARAAARTAIYWIERAAARGLIPSAEGRAQVAKLRAAVGLETGAVE